MTIGTKAPKKRCKRDRQALRTFRTHIQAITMLRLTELKNEVILKWLLNIKILRIFTIVCSVFLFFGGPGYYSPRSFKYLWDIGHIAFFCALSTLILLDFSTP